MAAAEAANSAIPAAQEAMRTAQTTAANAQATAQATAQSTAKAASDVVNSIPGSQIALNLVPQAVWDMANSILRSNNADWGKPKAVYCRDGVYLLIYSNSGLLGTGKPRMLYVDTIGPLARLERLQKQGY